MQKAVKLAVEHFGGIDGLIINAASCTFGRLEHIDLEALQTAFRVNVFAVLYLLQPSLPQLRKSKGRVVFVSSGAATGPNTGIATYAANKASLNSLARSLALEEPDILSLAINPGIVDTVSPYPSEMW